MNQVRSVLPVTRRRRAVVGALLGAFVVLLALVGRYGAPADGPDAPYDHVGFSEVSTATETVVDGEARVMAEGLEALGYWCVQPRSNDRAVQVTCLSAGRDVRLDLMAARDGKVHYVDVDVDLAPAPDDEGSRSAPDDRFRRVLDASLLKVWPQDRTTIEDLLDSAVPREFMPLGGASTPSDPEEQIRTHDVRTGDTSWTLRSWFTGEPLGLRVLTGDLRDRAWPHDGRHYATSLGAATTALTAAGFTCETSCYRAADAQGVVLEAHRDRIVKAELTLRTRDDAGDAEIEEGRAGDGLAFLTPAVRTAVGRRIEQSRVEHESWRGVVAGTPVMITAVPGGSVTPDGYPASDIVVTVGISLLDLE